MRTGELGGSSRGCSLGCRQDGTRLPVTRRCDTGWRVCAPAPTYGYGGSDSPWLALREGSLSSSMRGAVQDEGLSHMAPGFSQTHDMREGERRGEQSTTVPSRPNLWCHTASRPRYSVHEKGVTEPSPHTRGGVLVLLLHGRRVRESVNIFKLPRPVRKVS